MFHLQLVTKFYLFHLFPGSYFHWRCLSTARTYTRSSTSNRLLTDLPAGSAARPVPSLHGCGGWSLQTHLRLIGLSLAGNPRFPLPPEGLTRPHSQAASLQPAMPPAQRPCAHTWSYSLFPEQTGTDVLTRSCCWAVIQAAPSAWTGCASHLPKVCNTFSFPQGLTQISNPCSSPSTNPIRTNRSFLYIVSQFGWHFCCLIPCIYRAYCEACLPCNIYSVLLRFPLLLS